MAMMEQAVRHRLLLSLRSEQALGLRSVRVTTRVLTEAPELDDQVEEQPAVEPAGAAAESVAPVVPLISPPMISPPSAPAFAAQLLSHDEKVARLVAMDSNEVRTCIKCRLCEKRTHTVFGEGDVDAKIFFIGEGPGENEDLSGRPFVGRAGQLLDKMILAMGLQREQVYIANVVKCRPPSNRVPALDEVATCTPYLERQLEIVRPWAIVTLGRPATAYMLNDAKLTMGKSRGRWFSWRGIRLMPTYHPSYVLRTYTPETRKAVWDDLRQVMEAVGLPPPR